MFYMQYVVSCTGAGAGAEAGADTSILKPFYTKMYIITLVCF